MDQEQFLQSVFPYVGGKSNVVRHIWRESVLHLSLKDVGALSLDELRQAENVTAVELNRSRISVMTHGLEIKEDKSMAAGKFDELADKIIDLVGGKDNFDIFIHCVTRLRFNVKEKTKVQEAEIQKLSGVLGTKWADNQLQVIIGTDVIDAYQLICERNNITVTEKPNTLEKAADADQKTFSFMTIIEGINGCIIPLIPAFMGCALVRTFGIVLGMLGIISTEPTTYQLLDMVGIGCNYFMPILVASAAAKKFGVTESLAMGVCSLLLAPAFISNVADGVAMTLFGIPVYSGEYSSMLFPSIIIVFVMSYIERFFKRHIRVLQFMLIPLCTVLVMVPLEFCLLAPLGLWIGEIITNAIMFIYSKVGFIAVGLFTSIYPLLVFTGMHNATVPAMITCYMTYGFDPIILPGMTLSNFNQGFATLAVVFKTKKPKTKTTALGAAIPAIVAGVTEPALFGINFPHKVPLISAIIGGFAGGCYLGLQHVATYAAGGIGIMALLGFISSDPRTLIHGIIAAVISISVTFILTFIFYKDQKEEV